MAVMFEKELSACKVLPVVTVDNVATALQLAHALHRGGMTAMEITLRTEVALDSLAAIKKALPNMLVAAGTVVSPIDMEQAKLAGADICISPGISESLLLAAREQNVNLLPGVATASEVMLGLSHGCQLFKLFPAALVGGIELLKAFHGPFPNVRFCPTGGLTPDNFRKFLCMPNVICCGGSWMVADELVKEGAWEKVEALARDTLSEAYSE
jgi:2-dehydro-3-deoxyphosphogluconate aldolase/(4S)-4-hydroxy-2-oxoglutarate aldolase